MQLGIGVSCYVEITAGDYSGGETSRLVVDGTGAATVYTGSSPHGQGHATAYAMLVTSELGIPMDRITVRHGDTDEVPRGVGTYGSRSLQLGGSAVHQAAVEVREQARGLAAGLLEASEADLELDLSRGVWQVRGDPDTALSWAAVAGQAGAGWAGGRRRVQAGAARHSRSARTSRSSRWTPRPVRPPCSGTSPWTTRAGC